MNEWTEFDDYVNNVIMEEELYTDEALEQYLEELEWDELYFEMSDYVDIE
jgi:hypothetical protein